MQIPESNWRGVSTLTCAKAVAISLIVANHARLSVGLHGGLNVLLFISGVAMATYGFKGSTNDTLRAFLKFGARLAAPALIICLIWGLAVHAFGRDGLDFPKWFRELGFFSNWLYRSRISLFPIWYVQAIVQMLVVMATIFWIFDLSPKFRRSPFAASTGALLFSIVLALGSYYTWDTKRLDDKLPHLIAWNFTLGWVYWAVMGASSVSTARRIFITIVVLACAYVVLIPTGAVHGNVRIYWMYALILPLIWVNRVQVPAFIARIVRLVSAGTAYIFFLHYYVFWAWMRVCRMVGAEEFILPVINTFLGIGVPVLFWAAVTAIKRVFRRRRFLPCHSIKSTQSQEIQIEPATSN